MTRAAWVSEVDPAIVLPERMSSTVSPWGSSKRKMESSAGTVPSEFDVACEGIEA